MSYCRWSTDDYQCDLYCYEDGDGYVTHVANLRVLGEIPPLDWTLLEDPPEGDTRTPEDRANEFGRQHNAQLAFLNSCERVSIGGPYDGDSFHDYSLEDFRNRLLMLREAGYRFPNEVLLEVAAEMADEAATTRHGEIAGEGGTE